MRDFNFVSMKIQSFLALRFWKTGFFLNDKIFHKCALKKFIEHFLFRSGGWIVVSDESSSLLCIECWTIKYFLFLHFLIWFLTLNHELLFFVTVFLTLCPYFSHSSLYHSGFVLVPRFFIVRYFDFFSVKYYNDLSFFLDFRHFFGLQLISS